MTRTQLKNAARVLSSCADLAWRGAHIRAARLVPEPRILIDEPHSLAVVPSYGYVPNPRGCLPGPVWCVGQVGGVRVEWISRKGGTR